VKNEGDMIHKGENIVHARGYVKRIIVKLAMQECAVWTGGILADETMVVTQSEEQNADCGDEANKQAGRDEH